MRENGRMAAGTPGRNEGSIVWFCPVGFGRGAEENEGRQGSHLSKALPLHSSRLASITWPHIKRFPHEQLDKVISYTNSMDV